MAGTFYGLELTVHGTGLQAVSGGRKPLKGFFKTVPYFGLGAEHCMSPASLHVR